ncbi:hypothetical protein [Acetobacterium bakii]|uniref:Uncharacterized protein n=1 Tax=Acetobacterium bakii TaxID=52689 RepID=A0A0L6U2Y8_9FIRM|nr:hypothetical protein [Acetobacterium bakii]KNZ42732.1 hypothetical protein AKG39_04675 [Acetobacterium bakii]
MILKLNVVEIRTLLFEVNADNYQAAYSLLKEGLAEIVEPSEADNIDIKCIDDSGIVQLISLHDDDRVSEMPIQPENIAVCEIAAEANTPKLSVKFYDWRCILFLEEQVQGVSGKIWDITYEPYIELLKRWDMTENDVLDQVRNNVNSFSAKIGGCNQRISSAMINAVAEMIFRVIKRTTETGGIATDLSSIFFDDRCVLFMHDKYVNIGLKDICYETYIDLLEDQDLSDSDILGYIKNDIDDFITQFNRGGYPIDSAKAKKVSDIMEIIKFQLFP